MPHADISSAEVQAALDALCGSDLFAPQTRLKAFLSYIVTEETESRGDSIRGKTIAHDVYGRDPTDGADSDNVVRVDARRLRQVLDHYYETAGASDPVRIHVDPGGYRPRFERVDVPKDASAGPARRSFAVPALAFIVGSLAGVAIAFFIVSDDGPETGVAPETGSLKTLERQAIFDKSPASLQAVNLAEQAREMIFPIFDKPRQQLVSEVFQRVIDLDPGYFGGYAGAAQSLATLAIITPPGPDKDTLLAAADRMSREAVQLEPTDAWSQSARGWTEFALGNHDEAMKLARRSAELAPDSENVLDFFGSIALFTGHFDEAVAVAKRTMDAGSSNRRSANRNIFAAASFHLGLHAQSLEAFLAAAEYGNPVSVLSLAFQVANLHALGKTDEAMGKIEEIKAAWPAADPHGMLLGVYQHPDHAAQVSSHLDALGWVSQGAGN